MDRFWANVKYTKTCWLWTGSTSEGYGIFKLDGNTIGAHRVMYAVTNGPLFNGMQIDHLCRVRNCVNPEHLELVTPRENIIRAVPFRKKHIPSLLRTYCRQGHKYTKQNTLLLKAGGKFCKKCYEM